MSRLTLARTAVREAMKARMSIAGPSGSGKTLTALEVAHTLCPGGRVLGIDTERGEMRTYADVFPFIHLDWAPPYDPRELAACLTEASGQYDAIIVDSASHFWTAQGGTLDIADGKFGGWKVARPAQEDLVMAIKGCDAHVILGVRSKMEYTQTKDANTGRTTVTKLGMAPVQDSTLEYELNVALDIDMGHTITVTKSRTVAVPVGRTFAAGHADDFARIYGEWLAGGAPPLPLTEVEELRGILGTLDPHQASWARARWTELRMPAVHALLSTQKPDVLALIEEARKQVPTAPAPTTAEVADAIEAAALHITTEGPPAEVAPVAAA